SMRVLSGSMIPLHPTPTPAGSAVASSSQRMASCSEGRKPSRSLGVAIVREARMAPLSSTMPARICVPPISIPRTTIRAPKSDTGDAPPGIHVEYLAGNRLRCVFHQKDGGAGDVGNIDHSAREWLLLRYEFVKLARSRPLAHRRADEAGRKHIDADAVRRVV